MGTDLRQSPALAASDDELFLLAGNSPYRKTTLARTDDLEPKDCHTLWKFLATDPKRLPLREDGPATNLHLFCRDGEFTFALVLATFIARATPPPRVGPPVRARLVCFVFAGLILVFNTRFLALRAPRHIPARISCCSPSSTPLALPKPLVLALPPPRRHSARLPHGYTDSNLAATRETGPASASAGSLAVEVFRAAAAMGDPDGSWDPGEITSLHSQPVVVQRPRPEFRPKDRKVFKQRNTSGSSLRHHLSSAYAFYSYASRSKHYSHAVSTLTRTL
ncbi:hypothetical protein B0H14DRAFT_3494396 [Mycena olivaceomarginata]|nr:hypothetical protein B0H14DRAFT_3494396 [Mycena olivaceomarginata]